MNFDWQGCRCPWQTLFGSVISESWKQHGPGNDRHREILGLDVKTMKLNATTTKKLF